MKLKVFGKDALELEKMDNPQLERVIIHNVEGRCVAFLEIDDVCKVIQKPCEGNDAALAVG